MAKHQNYSKFTIMNLPSSTGDFDVHDINRDLASIVNNAIKSALPEGAYFKLGEKQILPNGQMSVDVYLHEDKASLVEMSARQQAENITFKGTSDSRYAVSLSTPVDTKTARALEKAEAGEATKLDGSETGRLTRSSLVKIIGVLTAIGDIARRILSSVISFSTQTTKDMTTAHNLGMSYEAVRAYRHTETVHGLKEGTISGAVSDIQSMFGNITMLDENALKTLAVVMGGKVEEMATMGLGSSNPEKMLGAILDAFNEKANAGYNSIGQYVGEQQARRELYSYLLKVSPQIADIFATMQEEQHNINSLYRNQSSTFEEWRRLFPTMRGGNKSMDYNVTYTLGEQWNQVQEMVKQIKETFVVGFAPAVLSLLRRISDLRVGMTATESAQRDTENKRANDRALASVDETIGKMEKSGKLSESQQFYLNALKEYRKELASANKGNIFGHISYAVRTPEEIRVLANQLAEESVNEDILSKSLTGMNSPVKHDKVNSETIKEILATYEHPDIDVASERREYMTKMRNLEKKREDKVNEYYNKLKAKEEKLRSKGSKNYAFNKAVDELSDVDSEFFLPSTTNLTERQNATIVREAEIKYNKDFSHDENGNLLSIGERVKKARDAGYIRDQKRGVGIELVPHKNEEIAPPPIDYGALMRRAKERYPEIDFDDNNFFMELYKEYAGYFNKLIFGQYVDELKNDSVIGNPWADVFALEDTEGTQADWQKRVPVTYTGGGTISSTNITEGGETVHVIKLNIDDGKTVQTYELLRAVGMMSVEGTWGTLTKKGDSYSIDVVGMLGEGASE